MPVNRTRVATEAAADYIAEAGGEVGGHLLSKYQIKYGWSKEGREARESQRITEALEKRLREQNPSLLEKIHRPTKETVGDVLRTANRKGLNSSLTKLLEDAAALGLGDGSFLKEAIAGSITAAGIEYGIM